MPDPPLRKQAVPRRVFDQGQPVGLPRDCLRCGRTFQPTVQLRKVCESCFVINTHSENGAVRFYAISDFGRRRREA